MMNRTFKRAPARGRFVKKGAASSSLVPVSAAKAESNLAKKVIRLEKLYRGLKSEVKYADVSVTTANVTPSTGLTLLMSSIAQGTAVNQRSGDNVNVCWIEMHGQVQFNASAGSVATDNPAYRVYIVQETQQVPSTSPVVGDLVDQPALPVNQLLNVAQQRRFRVLYDSGVQMLIIGIPTTASVNSSVVANAKWHLHIKKKVSIAVEFNGSAASSIQKNGIYFMLSTDAIGVAGASVLDWTGSTRVGFTDS